VRSPLAISPLIEELAVEIRKKLADEGWDHGPITVRQKLLDRGIAAPSVSTLARLFVRRGMVVPQPQKRPHSSYRRFEFEQVHGCWQLDAFKWALADGTECVVFQPLDDHSRFLLGSRAATGESTVAAQDTLDRAIGKYQPPQVLLSDNHASLNPSRRGHTGALVGYLHQRYGIKAITGRPRHPQTQGKDERVHSTTLKWLRVRPRADTLAGLQGQLEQFDHDYNHHRPHQGIGMRTPASAFGDDPAADPPIPPEPEPQDQSPTADIQAHKVAANGKVTVAYKHIQLGVEHRAETVLVRHTGDQISVFTSNGTLIRTVTIQPDIRYYGNGKPRGPRSKHTQPPQTTPAGRQPAHPPKRGGVNVERPQRSEDERP
jgi:transposase InsO family protein